MPPGAGAGAGAGGDAAGGDVTGADEALAETEQSEKLRLTAEKLKLQVSSCFLSKSATAVLILIMGGFSTNARVVQQCLRCR